MRKIHFQNNYLKHPAGSCLISQGNTRVLCAVFIEEKVPRFLEGTEKGWLTAEYAMLPGSTPGGRKQREWQKKDGRSAEIQRLIGRSLRSVIDLDKTGPISLVVDCDVIEADGGTRCASITGSWVALYQALEKLAEKQGQSGPDYYLKGQVAAISVGIIKGQIHIDLDYILDSQADVDMNVIMLDSQLVEIQGTGEKTLFSREQLNQMLDQAETAIKEIYKAQVNSLKNEKTSRLY
ncbi:MAG: ribonuclease PH [Spirochaetales bacterium]|nr:ribonuclease PH [Spirochaetales bacterium]